MTRVVSAVIAAATPMPMRTTRSESRPRCQLSPRTSAKAATAPTAAARVISPAPASGTQVTTQTAANPAPAVAPTRPGSASGFRQTAWTATPATARAAPPTSAASTRGSRVSRTKVRAGPVRWVSQLAMSPRRTLVSPRSMPGDHRADEQCDEDHPGDDDPTRRRDPGDRPLRPGAVPGAVAPGQGHEQGGAEDRGRHAGRDGHPGHRAEDGPQHDVRADHDDDAGDHGGREQPAVAQEHRYPAADQPDDHRRGEARRSRSARPASPLRR